MPDIYAKFQNSVVGGPAILFKRWGKSGQTYICHDPEMSEEEKKQFCLLLETISGEDANSLYLYALGQDQPTGDYIIRRFENGFLPENLNSNQSCVALEWLSHVEQRDTIQIAKDTAM